MGSERWSRQQEGVQSLNMAAHASAQAHGDEFVKEALLSHGKLDTLALNLLTFEVRRRNCGAPAWQALVGSFRKVLRIQFFKLDVIGNHPSFADCLTLFNDIYSRMQ